MEVYAPIAALAGSGQPDAGAAAFGLTNVALHRVSVAAELGDAPAALAAAEALDPSAFAPALRNRRTQVGLDLGERVPAAGCPGGAGAAGSRTRRTRDPIST